MEKEILANDIYLIKGFLSEAECKDFILQSEAEGYEEATVTTLEGQKMIKGIRNNQRVLLNSQELADVFWQKVNPFVTEKYDTWRPTSVNEQFRFYKYAINERFNRHRDGRFRRHECEESRLTLMVYLNDNFTGGETEFDDFSVSPETGTALIFRHDIKHKGCKVLSGFKYALRTDIMFTNYLYPMKESFTLSETFNASPAQLYSAWLDSKSHTEMTGGEAECSNIENQSFSAWDGYITGTNIAFEENEKIIQSWRTSEFAEDDSDSVIIVSFKEVENGTEVTIEHSNIPEGQTQYEKGWIDHYFTPMKAYFQ